MEKRVTIIDIAAQLGVAASTVNRALNGSPGVSEETRMRIGKIAREMNYRSNKSAKSFSRKTIKIGFIRSELMSVFHDDLQTGVCQAYEEIIDFNVSLRCEASVPAEEPRPHAMISILRVHRRGDGAAGAVDFSATADNPCLWERLRKSGAQGGEICHKVCKALSARRKTVSDK